MSKPKEQLMPPDDLIAEWEKEWWLQGDERFYLHLPFFVAKAAQWGADRELEACCEWLDGNYCDDPQDNANELRAARRPKPLSLKQQALEALDQAEWGLSESEWQQRSDIIRRAVEALPDDN